MAWDTNRQEGDVLTAQDWNQAVQEIKSKQSRLNVVDGLDSTSSVDVLSAKQGKVLNDRITDVNTAVENVSDKIDKLPTGIYYGQYDSEEDLEDVQVTTKGYAYIASTDPAVYYIYLYDGNSWINSGNKFVTINLETDLSTKSQTKAPTTKAVAEGIKGVNLMEAKTTPLTATQKYQASANINNRAAVVDQQTSEIKALGYKVLNPTFGFSAQVTAENTIYEIRDNFDLDPNDVIEEETLVINDYLHSGNYWYYYNENTTILLEPSKSPSSKMALVNNFLIYNRGLLSNGKDSFTLPNAEISVDESMYPAIRESDAASYKIGSGSSVPINLTSLVEIDGNVYFKYDTDIPLNSNQIITASGCVILNSSSDAILGNGSYKATSNTTVYIARKATTFDTISFKVMPYYEIPANCTLKFNGGKVKNGSLYASDIVIESNGVCFESIAGAVTTINAVNCDWFGNKSSDINKTIALFPAQNVNVYGSVDWDEEIVVPYNSSIVPHNMSISRNTGSDTLITLYCGTKDILLNDCKINISENFNGTCVRLIGSGNSTIAGYDSKGNATTVKIATPKIKGDTSDYAKTSTSIGVKVDLTQSKGYIYMYLTNIEVSCIKVNTAFRIEYAGNGTFNSNEVKIGAWHCVKGFSSNTNISDSNTVRLQYQCNTGDNYPIYCDIWNTSGFYAEVSPSFMLDIWDAHVADSVSIHNSLKGDYKTLKTTAVSDAHGAEIYFVNKPSENILTRIKKEVDIPYITIDGTFEIYKMLRHIYTSALTHEEQICALVRYTTTYITKVKSVKYILHSGAKAINAVSVRGYIQNLFDYNNTFGSNEICAEIEVIASMYKVGTDNYCKPSVVSLNLYNLTKAEHIMRVYTIGYESADSYKPTSATLISTNVKLGKGSSLLRPKTNAEDVGYLYYDTTHKKPLWYNGSVFTDYKGEVVEDSQGSIIERNNEGKHNYYGFKESSDFEELTYSETAGYWVIGGTGQISAATGESASQYSYATIDVENVTKVAFIGMTVASSTAIGYYFYDSSNVKINNSGAAYRSTGSGGIELIIKEVPVNAKYLKVTLRSGSTYNKSRFKAFSIFNAVTPKNVICKNGFWYDVVNNEIDALTIDDSDTFANASTKYGVNIPCFVGIQVECTDKSNIMIYWNGTVWKNIETGENVTNN